MALHNMMFNGVSGLNSMTGNMAVLGDNIANINTVSYKSARTTFQNVLTSSQERFGEVGNGSQVASISKNFRPGQLEGTSNATDMAITGSGFFMVNDPVAGEILYTRDGQFRLEHLAGGPTDTLHLVTPAGWLVQGVQADADGLFSGAVGDITVRRESQPQATEKVTLALNLENRPVASNAEERPLYAAWDGTRNPPLVRDAYDFHTVLQAYDDQGQSFDLKVYFDQTTNRNEREFIVTHDPARDQRLLGDNGARYGDDPDLAGAGALLYGRLIFTSTGELREIRTWEIPPDGQLVPGDDNMLEPDPRDGLHSFSYNISGVGPNLSAKIDFGATVTTQVATSGGGAKADPSGTTAPAVSAMTGWDRVYDLAGRQVGEGDQISFAGLNRNGEEVFLNYVVNFDERVENLLAELEAAFDCTVLIRNGRLEMHDGESGPSQLTINEVRYLDSEGNTPAENENLARIFGEDGSGFTVTPGGKAGLAPIRTTNYATASSALYQNQDGYGVGILQNITVKPDGVVVAHYSNGRSHPQAQVQLADFTDYRGLIPVANNAYRATDLAGEMRTGTPGSGAFGKVMGNSLEASNVDLGQQFADLIMTQRIFQANSKAITTANEIYDTLFRLK